MMARRALLSATRGAAVRFQLHSAQFSAVAPVPDSALMPKVPPLPDWFPVALDKMPMPPASGKELTLEKLLDMKEVYDKITFEDLFKLYDEAESSPMMKECKATEEKILASSPEGWNWVSVLDDPLLADSKAMYEKALASKAASRAEISSMQAKVNELESQYEALLLETKPVKPNWPDYSNLGLSPDLVKKMEEFKAKANDWSPTPPDAKFLDEAVALWRSELAEIATEGNATMENNKELFAACDESIAKGMDFAGKIHPDGLDCYELMEKFPEWKEQVFEEIRNDKWFIDETTGKGEGEHWKD